MQCNDHTDTIPYYLKRRPMVVTRKQIWCYVTKGGVVKRREVELKITAHSQRTTFWYCLNLGLGCSLTGISSGSPDEGHGREMIVTRVNIGSYKRDFVDGAHQMNLVLAKIADAVNCLFLISVFTNSVEHLIPLGGKNIFRLEVCDVRWRPFLCIGGTYNFAVFNRFCRMQKGCPKAGGKEVSAGGALGAVGDETDFISYDHTSLLFLLQAEVD